ncbi:MAG: GA module-containing protein [Corynebacterium sp.]|nr:GA module-containing protein [Corynebacterium sp.]
MIYGKRSISQMLGAMLLSSSMAMGSIMAPSLLSHANADPTPGTMSFNAVDTSDGFAALGNLMDTQLSEYKARYSSAVDADAAAKILESATIMNALMGTKATSTVDNHEAAEDEVYSQATEEPSDADRQAAYALVDEYYQGSSFGQGTATRNQVMDASTLGQLSDVIKSLLNTRISLPTASLDVPEELYNSYKESFTDAENYPQRAAIVKALTALMGELGENGDLSKLTDPAIDADRAAAKALLEAKKATLLSAGIDINMAPFTNMDKANATQQEIAEAVKEIMFGEKKPYRDRIDAMQYFPDEVKSGYENIINTKRIQQAEAIVEEASFMNTAMNPDVDRSTLPVQYFNEFEHSVVYSAMEEYAGIIDKPKDSTDQSSGSQPRSMAEFETAFEDAQNVAELAKVMLDILNAARENTKAPLEAYTKLTEAQQKVYESSIDSAMSAAALTAIANGAKAMNTALAADDPETEKTPASAADIAAVKAELEVLGYKDSDAVYADLDAEGITIGHAAKILIDASRDNAVKELNGYKNLTDEQRAVYVQKAKATTPELMPAIISGAGNINAIMGGNPSAEQQASAQSPATADDITAAQAAIAALVVGDGTTKHLGDLEQGSTQAVVAKAVATDLAAAKTYAKTLVDGDKNLTPEQQQSYKDAISAATGAAAINKIVETAGNIDGIMGGAPSAEQETGAQSPATADDIAAATAAIKAFELGVDEASTLAELSPNKSQSDVAGLVRNIQLKAKASAKQLITDAPNLTPEQKASYGEAIDAAVGATAINKIAETAGIVDTLMGGAPSAEQETAAQGPATSDDITAATVAIKAFNLGEDKEKEILAKISPNKSTKNVADAVTEAIATARAHTKNAIDALTHLTDEQKATYKDSVSSINSPAGLSDVTTGVSNVDRAMGGESPAEAKATVTDIAAAKAAINAITNLEATAKDTFLNEVGAAQTQAVVAKAVVDALTAAKTNAKNTVDGLKNLSDEEKTSAKADIDKATSGATISQLLTENKGTNSTRFTDGLSKAKQALAKAEGIVQDFRYTNASPEVKKAFDDNLAALRNLISAADAASGEETVSAAQLTAAADALTTTQEALDGVPPKFNWRPVLLAIGGIGAAGALVYALSTLAQRTPATPVAPAAPAPTEPAPVAAAPEAPLAAPAPRGALAITGAPVRVLALLGMTLVAVGGVFSLRRRKQS